MTPKEGKCVFCPRPGRLTRQHIWPRWLMKINQPHVTSHTQISAGARYDTPDTITVSGKLRQGHSGTRTVRKICKACNNGWIERLEEKIRAPLTKTMAGESIVLDAKLRHDFATWVTLVSMMAEFTDLNTISIPLNDHHFMYENGEPPPEWKIWIARYVGDQHDRFVLRHYAMQLADFPNVLVEPHKCDTQVTTFVLGQFCVHTFRSTILGRPNMPDYEVVNMPRIWPPIENNINWPNVQELSNAGVAMLSRKIIDLINPAPLPNSE